MHNLLSAALRAVEALEESIEYTQVPAWSPSVERRREALAALREALRLGLEPSGWKLVPLSPTPAMIGAHDEVLRTLDCAWSQPPTLTSSAWRAMLLSAPRLEGLVGVASARVGASERVRPAGADKPRPVRRLSIHP